jgi:hypothetical protein
MSFRDWLYCEHQVLWRFYRWARWRNCEIPRPGMCPRCRKLRWLIDRREAGRFRNRMLCDSCDFHAGFDLIDMRVVERMVRAETADR